MGKVKGLLMDMEDDAYDMTYKQFTDKWGESNAHVKIWNEHCDPSVTEVHSDLVKDYIETVSATPYEQLSLTEINQFLSDLDKFYTGLGNIK
tara:strand:+ start:174 stop:449 length:276 start_codon:yes stop_codon:yes gene_type:complete